MPGKLGQNDLVPKEHEAIFRNLGLASPSGSSARLRWLLLHGTTPLARPVIEETGLRMMRGPVNLGKFRRISKCPAPQYSGFVKRTLSSGYPEVVLPQSLGGLDRRLFFNRRLILKSRWPRKMIRSTSGEAGRGPSPRLNPAIPTNGKVRKI